MLKKIYSSTYVTARYAETDQMGIIHHSVYPVWFEMGRTDLIKKAGLTYTELEKTGILLPLIELTCTYKSSARYEDELVINSCVNEVSYSRISFYYEVKRIGGAGEVRSDSTGKTNSESNENNKSSENGVLIAYGKTFHVFADRGLKPVNMKKFNLELYEKLKLDEN